MLKFGNHKLGKDIAIFNMGTATDCPSKKLGLCTVVNNNIKCYAEKAEIQYKNHVVTARKRQEEFWKNTSKEDILKLFVNKIKSRRTETRYLRFNESGDFYCQEDIDKLSYISDGLKLINVTTYGYTARKDLNFENARFLVKGSDSDCGNNGKTMVILKKDKVPDNYIECPGSCVACNLCKTDAKFNIAFRKH